MGEGRGKREEKKEWRRELQQGEQRNLTQCFRLRVGGGNTGREWTYTRKWLSEAFPVELLAVKILKYMYN